MSLEIWIGFAVASLVLLSIPGPTVMLVISYALGRGRSTAWVTVPGVALGDFTAMTLSLLVLAVLTNGIWALLAGEMRARFTSRRVARAVNRLGAGFLVGAGALTVLARRSS